MSEAQSITLTTADGYRLGATCYPAMGPLRGRIIVASATAVPQGFYRRFAEHARRRGYESLTFDYRGIGQSRPSSLKGFRMDLLDWARQDLAAAVDAMPEDGVPLFVAGHSYAGHAFGLLPNHAKVAGFHVSGTGAGWHGWMPIGERIKVLALWTVLGPVTSWKGYSPWRALGMGEDIPEDAFRQWRHWCRFPHYFFDDPAMRGIEASYAKVTTPIIAANALDDLWAAPASRDAFVKAYCNAPLTKRDLDPRSLGRPIGHMGYFRHGAEPLWDEMLDWFASLPKGRTAKNLAWFDALPSRQSA